MEEDAYVGKWVRPNSDSPLEMVGRKGSHDLDWLAGYIVEKLALGPDDTVLDVCCGNGLVTRLVAPQVKSMLGVDFSHMLLQQAEQISAAPNLRYAQADARNLDAALQGEVFDKAYLCAAFQYFDDQAGREVLAGLRRAVKPGGVVKILDIPDKALKRQHQIRSAIRILLPSSGDKNSGRFASFGERLGYLGRNVANVLVGKKTDDLGWWWSREDFAAAARSAGFECQTLDQPRNNPHHTYRFDAVLR